MHPSGEKSFLVNHRAGEGGRKAPNSRVAIGRVGRVTPDQARRKAQELLGHVAAGDEPAGERADTRALLTLGDACEEYLVSGRGRAASTDRAYRRYTSRYLGDWLGQPLDAITRRDIESRFQLVTERHGAVPANQCLSFLRSVYRRHAWITRACAIRWSSGLPGRGATTARRASGYRLRPRCCPLAGGYRGGGAKPRESRPLVVPALHGDAPG